MKTAITAAGWALRPILWMAAGYDNVRAFLCRKHEPNLLKTNCKKCGKSLTNFKAFWH